MEKKKENILNKQIEPNTILLLSYAFLSISFALPSVIYLLKNRTVYNFVYSFSYLFIRTDSLLYNFADMAIYGVLFILLFLLYFTILKNRNKILKTKKQLFTFITLVGFIFCLIIPQTSLDVYSYIGNGWTDSHYNENPYYTPVQTIMDEHGVDEMLGKVARVWRSEIVVYGPAWSLICKVLTLISFGKITSALFIFKIAALAIYIACSLLIYKITKKKLFVLLFALNPFILFEYLANVHNDLYLAFFILLAIYFVKNRKNVALAVASLAVATAMKYLSIIFVPFIVIYALRKETLKNKIIKTCIYIVEFFVIILAFYLIYIKDFQVLAGIFIQQNKYERSLMLIIWYLLNQDEKIMSIIKIVSLAIFVITYIIIICKLFFKKETENIKFTKTIQTYQAFLIVFTFLLITNFNAWYVVWLFPTIMWQRAKNIKTTLYISAGVIASYAVTYFTKIESRESGIAYFIIMLITIAIFTLRNQMKKEV